MSHAQSAAEGSLPEKSAPGLVGAPDSEEIEAAEVVEGAEEIEAAEVVEGAEEVPDSEEIEGAEVVEGAEEVPDADERDEAAEGETLDGPLPEPVRLRVVALAADALSRVPADQLPASLRRVAAFAPARRAKLAGNQIAMAIDGDSEFRARLATQVRAAHPTFAAAMDSEEAASAVHPVELAAFAYLLRPAGWTSYIAAGASAVSDPAGSGHRGDWEERLQRLTAQLTETRSETKQKRDRLKTQIETLKDENATLRRKLAEARQRTKQAVESAESAGAEAATVQVAAERSVVAAESEARRLKAKLSELGAAATASKRATRDERDVETMRLRLLLDVLVEGASGLRRELGLPPADTMPAEMVEMREPGTAETSGVGRHLASDDPALLAQLLDLPRVHLIIDGYNVTKTAWPTATLEQQRSKLVSGIAGLVASKGFEVTIVFDGAQLVNTPPVHQPRGVRVRFSPPGVIADEVVRRLVAAEPTGRPVVVVSTDREVVDGVVKMGARAVQSMALARLLSR